MVEQPLRQVLLASDLSGAAARAADRAVQLAAENGARLLACHVMPYVMPSVDSYEEVDQDALQETLYREAHRALEAQLNAAPEVGVSPELRVAEGSAVPVLLETMEEVGADLMVVGVRGQNSLRDHLIGSTADRLIRRGHRPTLVVRQPAEGPYTRVLVGVDLSEQSRRALELAAAWFGAERLVVVHVLDSGGFESLQAAGIEASALADYRRDQAARAVDDLAVIVRRAGLEPEGLAACEVAEGHPGHALLERAREQGCDLVALGTHGRNRLADWVLGGVAMAVLHAAENDVLLV